MKWSSLVDKIIERIFKTRRITRYEQNWLCKVMVSDRPLNYEQNKKIRKLYDFVRMGFVQVMD